MQQMKPTQSTTTQFDFHSSTILHIDSNKLQPPIQTAKTKSTPIQNAKLNNWNPSKTQPPIWSLWLHHSHRFKQALATKTDSKTHHRFSNPRRFNPPLKPSHRFNFNTRIETQPTYLWNPANSNHLWNPCQFKPPIQPTFETQPIQTTTLNPVNTNST